MNNKDIPVITLDGPSGTGKGTITHMLADHLGWHFLDSGALYRVLAFAAKKNNIEFSNIHQLVSLAHSLNLRFAINEKQENLVFLDEQEIGQDLRSESCGQEASKIAVIPEVRDALLARQRAFAIYPGLVTDGRDMGTVVFPDAVLKIYLHATEEERAQRRYLQLKKKGIHASLTKVVDELAQRDARDTARSHSPLKPAPDAVSIDTTGLSVIQVFERVLTLVDTR